jgi:diacylglycerol kinase family enzyme
MKKAKLHHNPGAGEEDYTEEELCTILRNEGFECRHFSTENDFIIVAGGDGTVRKTVKELLQKEDQEPQVPLALLPMGTANNIANALSITGKLKDIIRNWHQHHLLYYDAGTVSGVPETSFFLEGLGCGVFPQLIHQMKPLSEVLNNCETSEKIRKALEELHALIPSFEAIDTTLQIDGNEYKGRYLLVEIMNIRSIGPNLVLAPHADPGDGMLEVVLVPEEQRFALALYVQEQLNGIASTFPFPAIQARQATLQCNASLLHIDDQLIENPAEQITLKIALEPGRLSFLV